MRNSYEDMFALIAAEPLARRYFENLPDALRFRLAGRADGIHSMDELKRRAETLAALG